MNEGVAWWLTEHGLKLKPQKCELFKAEIRYLGGIVLAAGSRMDQDDTAAVTALKNKQPVLVGELRAILRRLSYYQQHIKDFSHIASPLYDLLKTPVQTDTTQNTNRKWQTKRNTRGITSSTPIEL